MDAVPAEFDEADSGIAIEGNRAMRGTVTRLLSAGTYKVAGKLGRVCPPALGRVLRRLLGSQGISSDFFAKAHTLASVGQHEEAIDAIKASLSFQPSYMPAHETLIQLLAYCGRYEQALDACARALRVDADSQAVFASLRQILPNVGHTERSDKVIRNLNECLAASPGQLDVFWLVSEKLLRLRRYRDVVQACERALEVDPEFLPAAAIIGKILKDPDAQRDVAALHVATGPRIADEYNWLVAGNVVDLIAEVMIKFYTDLGVDAHSAPLMQGLDRFRRKLSMSKPDTLRTRTTSILVEFERAWFQYRRGRIEKALRLFETIFRDATARKRAAHNPFVKEAVVRSGEILGRHHDKLGNVDQAIAIYREIMAVDRDGLTARRLMLLLSRRGNLREAAELAETAIISRPNLFPYLPQNPYIASLKVEISLE